MKIYFIYRRFLFKALVIYRRLFKINATTLVDELGEIIRQHLFEINTAMLFQGVGEIYPREFAAF